MKTKNKFKSGGIRHHHITRVMYTALVAFSITTGLIIGIYSDAQRAQATIGQIPFGGPILYAQPLPLPNFIGAPCPAHIVIMDENLPVPKPVGIAIPGSFLPPLQLTFDYGNLFTPGVETLGEHALIPIPSCIGTFGVYYPVYMAFFNPEYFRFQMGTGLFPGF